MDYVAPLFRPPSEADSLLIQVTVGCSHNRCTYCDMYRGKTFRPKPWQTVQADLQECRDRGPEHRRVFLMDGDALILSTDKLLRILEGIRSHTPWIERVGIYGDTRSVGRKSVEELTALRKAGLGIVYHGMESGDDEVLKAIDKGGNSQQCVETAHKLREAGITHSVMVLLGVGGQELSEQHAKNTAKTLTRMDPVYVGALTTTVVPNTPLHVVQKSGAFALPSKFEMLQELRTIIADSEFTACRFSANHASNYLPLRGNLPTDKIAILSALDEVISSEDERYLKPEGLRGL